MIVKSRRLAPGKWKVGISQGHYSARPHHICSYAGDLREMAWFERPSLNWIGLLKQHPQLQAIHTYEPGLLKLYVRHSLIRLLWCE